MTIRGHIRRRFDTSFPRMPGTTLFILWRKAAPRLCAVSSRQPHKVEKSLRLQRTGGIIRRHSVVVVLQCGRLRQPFCCHKLQAGIELRMSTVWWVLYSARADAQIKNAQAVAEVAMEDSHDRYSR
jgi:hypothetical protein